MMIKNDFSKEELLFELYVRKNYHDLTSKLVNSTEPYCLEILARTYLELLDFSNALNIYEKLGMKYEFGRVLLLQGKLDEAKSVWYGLEINSPLVLWGRALVQFIERYVIDLPAFFRIRSFLEVDLDALMRSHQYEFCENIINCADLMAQNNTECYKFIGRVFVNHKLYDIAKIYLQKAKEVCYSDPEVHYLFAKCYMANNNSYRAIESLKTCLQKVPEYYPAQMLLNELVRN